MNVDPYSVAVVLDRDYGPRLWKLLEAGPVWIVDSQVNREIAEKVWKEFPSRDHLDGVTVFKAESHRSAEEVLIDEFETIDLHHGGYSADPSYTVIKVVGIAPTAEVKMALSRYGFESFSDTAEGFQAVRPLPKSKSS